MATHINIRLNPYNLSHNLKDSLIPIVTPNDGWWFKTHKSLNQELLKRIEPHSTHSEKIDRAIQNMNRR